MHRWRFRGDGAPRRLWRPKCPPHFRLGNMWRAAAKVTAHLSLFVNETATKKFMASLTLGLATYGCQPNTPSFILRSRMVQPWHAIMKE